MVHRVCRGETKNMHGISCANTLHYKSEIGLLMLFAQVLSLLDLKSIEHKIVGNATVSSAQLKVSNHFEF